MFKNGWKVKPLFDGRKLRSFELLNRRKSASKVAGEQTGGFRTAVIMYNDGFMGVALLSIIPRSTPLLSRDT